MTLEGFKLNSSLIFLYLVTKMSGVFINSLTVLTIEENCFIVEVIVCHSVTLDISLLSDDHCNDPLICSEASGSCYFTNTGTSPELLLNSLLYPCVMEI